MHAILLIFGVVAAALGAAMIGFGFWIDLSFGNALLTSGVTALVGGVAVMGLAAGLQELRAVTALLNLQAGIPAGRSDDGLELSTGSERVMGRVPMRPQPSTEVPERPVRAAEPRLPIPSADTPTSAASVTQGARLGMSAAQREAQPEMVDAESYGMSGRAGQDADTERLDASLEPAARPPSDMRVDPSWRSPPHEAGPYAFETMWPASARAEPPPMEMRDPAADEPMSSGASEAEFKPSRTLESTAPSADRHAGEPMRSVSILKAGVVDGMAYTLYSDGSIEAELAEGTIRFRSIEELREHLEAHE